MSAAALVSSEIWCMSTRRYCVYILISTCAVGCYSIASAFTSMPISVSSGFPLLSGYIAHKFFKTRLQNQQSLQYYNLLSATLLLLGDATRLISGYLVADPDAMTSAHLASTHFCLAFLVLSETEYFSRIQHHVHYPDVFLTPGANIIASYYPNSPICRHCRLSDGRKPSAAIEYRALALDLAVCTLGYIGVWRFTSLIQAQLNPSFQPKAGLVYRPFTTAYGYEVIWTSKGIFGHLLQCVLMRPFRILNSYIFACGADGVRWLRRRLSIAREYESQQCNKIHILEHYRG